MSKGGRLKALAHHLRDLVPKGRKLKALELQDKHVGRLLDGHLLGRADLLVVLGALVLVGAIQVLHAHKALQAGALHAHDAVLVEWKTCAAHCKRDLALDEPDLWNN